jgi:hypothetical protein
MTPLNLKNLDLHTSGLEEDKEKTKDKSKKIKII